VYDHDHEMFHHCFHRVINSSHVIGHLALEYVPFLLGGMFLTLRAYVVLYASNFPCDVLCA